MKYVIPLFFALCFQISFSQDLPENPNPGFCYVRCLDEDEQSYEWKEIDCGVLEFRIISLDIYSQDNNLSEKDKENLKNKLMPLFEKGAAVQIASHYDSEEDETINFHKSVKFGMIVSNYLYSLGIDKKLLIVTGYGNSKPKRKCPIKTACKEKIYTKNTRIEYRVINTSN